MLLLLKSNNNIYLKDFFGGKLFVRNEKHSRVDTLATLFLFGTFGTPANVTDANLWAISLKVSVHDTWLGYG